MLKKKVKVAVNLETAIKLSNERRDPETDPLDVDSFCKNELMTRTTFYNWKKGRVPKAFTQLFSFMVNNNLTVEDLKEVVEITEDIEL